MLAATDLTVGAYGSAGMQGKDRLADSIDPATSYVSNMTAGFDFDEVQQVVCVVASSLECSSRDEVHPSVGQYGKTAKWIFRRKMSIQSEVCDLLWIA